MTKGDAKLSITNIWIYTKPRRYPPPGCRITSSAEPHKQEAKITIDTFITDQVNIVDAQALHIQSHKRFPGRHRPFRHIHQSLLVIGDAVIVID